MSGSRACDRSPIGHAVVLIVIELPESDSAPKVMSNLPPVQALASAAAASTSSISALTGTGVTRRPWR